VEDSVREEIRMSTSDLEEMKKEKAQHAAAAKIRAAGAMAQSALGAKRTKKLQQAGVWNTGTLLHEEVSKKHGYALFQDYKKHISASMNQDRFRYLTVIHDLVALDKARVLASCEQMVMQLHKCLDGRGIWWLGVIETEIVSLKFLRGLQDHDEGARYKLILIEELEARARRKSVGSARMLVHAHIVIDLGSKADDVASSLRDICTQVWRGARAVELKKFSENWKTEKRTLHGNLKHISYYGTKCGNESLRYKAGYGRDYELDTEARMWKACGRDLISEDDDGAVEDARSLTFAEINFLDRVTRALMDLRKDGRGYLIGSRRNQL